MKDIFKRLDTD